MKNQLRAYNCSRADFDAFIRRYSCFIEKADDLQNYLYGYNNSPRKGMSNLNMLYGRLNNVDWLIVPEYLIKDSDGDWRQIALKKDDSIKTSEGKPDENGNHAYNWVMNIVGKYYEDGEIDAIFGEFSSEFDQNFRQFHFDYDPRMERVLAYELTDCVKYDINGAHCDALCEIFPKCADEFAKLYKERKIRPEIKKFFNYAVGMMKRKGHEGTYNWIVQRTTDKLLSAIEYVGGELIYANTDGFIAKNPKNLITPSKELGEFKEEYRGNVYFYQDKNYNLYQMGNQKVGRAWQEVRDDIDLSKGYVAHYDVVMEHIKLKKGEYIASNIKNIVKEKLQICRI